MRILVNHLKDGSRGVEGLSLESLVAVHGYVRILLQVGVYLHFVCFIAASGLSGWILAP